MWYIKWKLLLNWIIFWKPFEKQTSSSPFMAIWSNPIFGIFQRVIMTHYNDGIMKPLAEIDRNGLEYYSPVNFESIDTHFGIVLLGYQWVVYHGPIWYHGKVIVRYSRKQKWSIALQLLYSEKIFRIRLIFEKLWIFCHFRGSDPFKPPYHAYHYS